MNIKIYQNLEHQEIMFVKNWYSLLDFVLSIRQKLHNEGYIISVNIL